MKQDDLIYDLIFSEKTNYRIDVSDYVSDIYKHDDFVDKIPNDKLDWNFPNKPIYQLHYNQ